MLYHLEDIEKIREVEKKFLIMVIRCLIYLIGTQEKIIINFYYLH